MKKSLKILLALLIAVLLFSCGGARGLDGSEEITMDNVDQYIGMDARFVDLRNYADMFNGGYIAGFEIVPFFQYLEGRALVRNNGWEYSSADVISKAILENVFGPREDVIVLMCGSGTRAGYVKAALEDLGYTKVINAGGIKDYKGENKVMGDGVYAGVSVITSEVSMENIDKLMSRPGAKYVDLRNFQDMLAGGYIDGFEVVPFFQYLEGRALNRNSGWEFSDADISSKIVLQNIFGDKEREIFLMCGSGTRAGYVKAALESIGYTSVYNVGGIKDYQGDRKILGDDQWTLVLK